ncbi:MAG TPA: peptidyl-tRNA hydrolase [Cyclobacteriaceae bacterium]|nr:peptidyl-tRNA hydrolase [Cyclobacteriaceae bacterium]
MLVTRRDLTPGYQAVQPAHALSEFAIKYPKTFKNWQVNQKNLVILSVANELALGDLFQKAKENNVKAVMFKEPDIGNELTAITLEPCEQTYKLTSSLPLALKEYSDMRESRKASGG